MVEFISLFFFISLFERMYDSKLFLQLVIDYLPSQLLIKPIARPSLPHNLKYSFLWKKCNGPSQQNSNWLFLQLVS